MSATITPSFYRIDLTKIEQLINADNPISAGNAHEAIRAYHQRRIEQGLSTAKPFHLLSEQRVGQYQAAIYGTRANTRPHAWSDLFPEQISELEVKYPNLAAFLSQGDTCYAISSGMGHTLFEQFIDTSFPLEVARHIMNPKLSATTERDITGAVYGRVQQFRTSQLIVSSQNLGTVWQAITGDITDATKARPDFVNIFQPNKGKISVDAGSSLKIHKAVEINKLVALLDWIDVVLGEDVPAEQVEAFRFLDGLREVSPRKNSQLIDDIKVSLGEQLLNCVTSNTPIDLDYSHKNFSAYQSAESYHFTGRSLEDEWEYPPSVSEVFKSMQDGGALPIGSSAELLEALDHTSFLAEHDDTLNDTQASVLDHLHGEVVYNGKIYFLIDGKFYAAKDSFIDRVTQDFDGLLRGNHFVPDSRLSFDNFTNAYAKEGDYNDSYKGKDSWFVGDRVFIDNVEIADLFHWVDNKLFIVHNKIGFGVTVRDVCSQILLSMNIVNRLKDTGDSDTLGAYYDRIIAKHYSSTQSPISKADFIAKIQATNKTDIVYVIGYAQQNPVSTASRSNIAKFEAIKLCNTDRRPFDFELKIIHIPQT